MSNDTTGINVAFASLDVNSWCTYYLPFVLFLFDGLIVADKYIYL